MALSLLDREEIFVISDESHCYVIDGKHGVIKDPAFKKAIKLTEHNLLQVGYGKVECVYRVCVM